MWYSTCNMRWHDKRQVVMLSSIHTGQMKDSGKIHFKTKKPIMKPDLVLDYTKTMRLVDKTDMMVSFIDCISKTQLAPQPLFHLIDITLLNAYNFLLIKK
uniref:PiggyBac transposable element-derived protein domain-containing protein n=1 Tax=Scylla olivacea TaxID=85551 RepID=A0A0N7ZD38_SCYOL